MKKITIAIDGFSSCGKSTMAKDLAREIGYIYIDSGAMYRAVTLYSIENSIFQGNAIDTERLRKEIDNIHISFQLNPETGRPDTYLNGVNVENKIRSMEVSSHVISLCFINCCNYFGYVSCSFLFNSASESPLRKLLCIYLPHELLLSHSYCCRSAPSCKHSKRCP